MKKINLLFAELTTKILNFCIKRPYFLFKRFINKLDLIINKLGSKKKCNICNKTFIKFKPYSTDASNNYISNLDIVGTDIKNCWCIYCSSYDRERHLFLYFDKLNLWDNFNEKKVLHFAPEIHLSRKIETFSPLEYIKCDFNPNYLFPGNSEIENIDATNINYEDSYFDIVICNHVLEHIPEYNKALKEIYRVLKRGGIAILQTPYSKLLKNNFEDPGINNDSLRNFFYGQFDHVRILSENQFFNDLKKNKFKLKIMKHKNTFDSKTSHRYGVNSKEDLIMVEK